MFLISLAKQYPKVGYFPIANIGRIAYWCTSHQNNTYEFKKSEKYAQKYKQNFNVNQQSLISQNIIVDALVPNLFTNQLTLQKYPQRKIIDKGVNYFLNSYSRITLPLASKPKLREKLNKLFDKQVRLGRILQLMDSIAGIVSYSHCRGGFAFDDIKNNPMVCVTGSVELLHLFDKIDIEKDMTIEGYLTHVGRTSMEIQINLSQQNKLKANSVFTMIARNAKNHKQGYQIPALSFQGLQPNDKQKALIRSQHAKVNLIRRKKQIQTSYDRQPPSSEDISQIHKMFLQRKSESEVMGHSTNPISQTLIQNCQIMHTQRRNLHGKIFGGFLVRQMIELAWIAGCKYSEDFNIMEDLTNIYFKKPVDIGCRLTLKAMVTYVEGNRLIVTVEAYTSKFSEKHETLACFMHLISRSSKQMKKVHPQTYEQALQYLSSRKAYDQLFY